MKRWVPRSDLRADERTTAHIHISKFYSDLMPKARAKSILETIQAAPSEFSLEITVRDAMQFAHANRKTWGRWLKAVRSRVLHLRGHVA